MLHTAAHMLRWKVLWRDDIYHAIHSMISWYWWLASRNPAESLMSYPANKLHQLSHTKLCHLSHKQVCVCFNNKNNANYLKDEAFTSDLLRFQQLSPLVPQHGPIHRPHAVADLNQSETRNAAIFSPDFCLTCWYHKQRLDTHWLSAVLSFLVQSLHSKMVVWMPTG